MEMQTNRDDTRSFLKKNFAIVLAFLLPILLIVGVVLSIYIPSKFLSTDYDFVYTSCTDGVRYDYRCDNYLPQRYSVVDAKLVVNDIDPEQDSDKNGVKDIDEKYNARIFLHNTQTNESREITKEEAMSLTLSGLLTSPDGVTVSDAYNRNGGDFFYLFGGGSSSYGHYLTKGKSKKRLDLINDDGRYYYWNNFQFIGWVSPGRN
jgi:hypothetical protein